MVNVKRGRSRQPELSPRLKSPTIPIPDNHRLVVMTDEIDWTEMEELLQRIRMERLKSEAGRPAHLRALAGAPEFGRDHVPPGQSDRSSRG